MKGIILRVASLMVLLGGLSVAPASAAGQVSFSVGIGVPVAPVFVGPAPVFVRPPVAPVVVVRRVAPVFVARPVIVAPVRVVRPVVVAPAPSWFFAPAPYPGFVWRPAYFVRGRYFPGAWVRRP